MVANYQSIKIGKGTIASDERGSRARPTLPTTKFPFSVFKLFSTLIYTQEPKFVTNGLQPTQQVRKKYSGYPSFTTTTQAICTFFVHLSDIPPATVGLMHSTHSLQSGPCQQLRQKHSASLLQIYGIRM